MTIAIAFFLVASVVLVVIEQRLVRLADTDAGIHWLSDHIYVPLLRTLVVLGFVALAYPALFGLATAPRLPELLGGGRADLVITAAFAASLVLPLLPFMERLPGAIMAAQGILACCLLAGWLGHAVGLAPTRLWAGWFVALQVVAILLAGKLLGRAIVKFYVPRQAQRFAPIIEEGARLASAIPAISLYSLALGRQFVHAA